MHKPSCDAISPNGIKPLDELATCGIARGTHHATHTAHLKALRWLRFGASIAICWGGVFHTRLLAFTMPLNPNVPTFASFVKQSTCSQNMPTSSATGNIGCGDGFRRAVQASTACQRAQWLYPFSPHDAPHELHSTGHHQLWYEGQQ